MAGALMAHKGGPYAMLLGCSGFAAFSLVIGESELFDFWEGVFFCCSLFFF
jgi:hypothetical protein